MNVIQAKTMLSAMATIAEMATPEFLSIVGMTEEDYLKLTGRPHWLASDRNRVCQSFHSLMFGVLDSQGIPRFQLPGEYVAAAIFMFISPTNIHSACSYFQNIPTNESLMRGDELDTYSASQLFALVMACNEGYEVSLFRNRFEQNCNLKLQQTMEQIENQPVKKGAKNER